MSRWRLAAVMATAFDGRPVFAGLRRWQLRPMFWVQLVLGEWRANETGTAVCCLSYPSTSAWLKAGAASLLGLVGCGALVVFSSVTWPVVVVLTVAALTFWPLARRSFVGRAARRELRAYRPPGRWVLVHSVASVERGAGRELMLSVNREADANGWGLLVEAANEVLVGYYRDLGYVRVGRPVVMASGAVSSTMVRPARSPSEVTL